MGSRQWATPQKLWLTWTGAGNILDNKLLLGCFLLNSCLIRTVIQVATRVSLDNTCGYDMDGNAQLASVVLTNLPEPFAAKDADKLKEGIPEGLSDMAREHGQRWAMEDRMSNRFTYLN